MIGAYIGHAFDSLEDAKNAAEHKADTKHTKIDEATKPQEPFWQKAFSDPVATFTLALVGFTAVLSLVAIVQIRYLVRADNAARRSNVTARKSANASVRASRAALQIELPVIRADTPDLLFMSKPLPPQNQTYSGTYRRSLPNNRERFLAIEKLKIRNFGRSASTPLQTKIGWLVTDRLPPTPIYTGTVRSVPHAIVPPNDSRIAELHYGFELTDADLSAINKDGFYLWVFAKVEYLDFMDGRHEVGFCWRWEIMDTAGSYGFWRAIDVPHAYVAKT